VNNTRWIGYRTAYAPATETRGARIKVLNLETGKSRMVPFDYEVGAGQAQHLHGLTQAAAGNIARIERCGEWDKGYYFVVEKVEEE
jgi:hypothetical protein